MSGTFRVRVQVFQDFSVIRYGQSSAEHHHLNLSVPPAVSTWFSHWEVSCSLKKNQSASRPSEHPPVMGEKVSMFLTFSVLVSNPKRWPIPLVVVFCNSCSKKNLNACRPSEHHPPVFCFSHSAHLSVANPNEQKEKKREQKEKVWQCDKEKKFNQLRKCCVAGC